MTASVALVTALAGFASPGVVDAASPSPTPFPIGPPRGLTITIESEAFVAEGSDATCPAQVSLTFYTGGGDPTTMLGHASLYAQCTDRPFAAIDASGTFDGQTFSLTEGRYVYSGTFDGHTATITGGLGSTFAFPVPPPPTPPPTPQPTPTPTEMAEGTTAPEATADEWTMPPSDPSVEPVGFTQDASGDVYISPASEQDLQPADRHWQRITPGQRISLDDGAMLRTGQNGEVAIVYGTGALTRLKPSTLFTMKQLRSAETSQTTMYGRLYEGIAAFYMGKWKDSGKGFEVETDRANTSIKGTTYEIEVTDSATIVTVTEGVVEVTDKATATVINVGPGEIATVDATGVTKAAAPAASGPQAAPSPAAAPAATAAPASPTDANASGLPIGMIVVSLIAAAVVAGVIAFAFARRRSSSTGPSARA